MPPKIFLFFACFVFVHASAVGVARGQGGASGYDRPSAVSGGTGESELFNSLGEDFTLEVRGYYWLSSLGSKVRSDEGDLKGTEIDIADDLGIDKQKGFLGGELTLKFLERHKLRFSAVNMSYDARKNLETQITFQGKVYSARVEVASQANVRSMRAGYEFDLIRTDGGYLAAQLAANYLEAEVSLAAPGFTVTREKASVVIPVVGLSARQAFGDYVSGTVEIAYMSYEQASSVDGAVYIDFNPTKNLGLTVGWKTIRVGAATDGFDAHVNWDGFFAGVAFRI